MTTIIFKLYLPALAWLLLVTGFSVTPNVTLPKFDLFSTDKIGHLAAYGLLVWLILYSFKRVNKRTANWKEGLSIVCFATLYGAILEFVQGAFIPGRVFGYDDMIANALGAAVTWGFCFWKPRSE